jgi:glycosyltransferase involved in cell wall biosynthesis
MTKMASDPDFRQRLIAAGKEQRNKFSWKQTAEKLWDCIEKAAE